MIKLKQLLQQLETTPETVEFDDVINVINETYVYTPTAFTNGCKNDKVINKIGENEGSCKIFSFSLMHQLNETQTLNCFGQYYREDVLNHPDKTDHANIRSYIRHGWKNLKFESPALIEKNRQHKAI